MMDHASYAPDATGPFGPAQAGNRDDQVATGDL